MNTTKILDKMAQAPLVFDGAMGTLLYSRGVFINRCFEEVCLTDAKMLSDIHAEYARAGADVIETNTFGANRIKLQGYGLADRVGLICREAVRLAREATGFAREAAARDAVYVAGSVGPCLRPGQFLGHANRQEVRDAFAETIAALAQAGVDLILLETFSDLEELELALDAAAGLAVPLLASFAFSEAGHTAHGLPLENVFAALEGDPRVNAVGLNCGCGPSASYELCERALAHTVKPLVAMPNAGMPREVEGRMLYLTSPEYFTSYAKRLIQLGVRGVGGCCGTTPEHIRMAARAVKSLSGVKRHIEIKPLQPTKNAVKTVPAAEKSRMGGKLARGEKVTSIEVLPPRSSDLTAMLAKVRRCYHAGVDVINIPDGPRASARVSPMIAAITIQQQVGMETVLHYCCRDRNLIGMQSDLLGAYAAGLSNFLMITGDPPKLGDYPDVTGVFDVDAIGLTQLAANLNHGLDLGGNPITPPTGILIGVGANPCAVEPKTERERFRLKVEAGAEYAITQPVFDAASLLRFMDEIGKFSSIPVIAGIWPLTSYKNAEFMRNEVPGVTIPDAVMERMRDCATKEDGLRVGVEIAREIKEKIADRVAGFQVSAPFGNVELAVDVLRP